MSPAAARGWLLCGLILFCSGSVALAQPAAPDFEQCRLDAIYPAGGKAGERVKVEFLGYKGGLATPKAIVIDGPPGVTAESVTAVDANRVTAELVIAADAVPGRRAVRVLSEQSGLTNQAWFIVGQLPEQQEAEPNSEMSRAERITLPVTMNGRIAQETDVDWFQFEGQAGQRVIAFVQSASFDAHGQGRSRGYVDAEVAVLDSTGRVLAEAQDSIGLDPLVELKLPGTGRYFVRVQLMGYLGFPQAVYRCCVGDLSFPTSIFPPGGQTATAMPLQLAGPGISAPVTVTWTGRPSRLPFEWVNVGPGPSCGFDLPLVLGALPERIEAEPNDSQQTATLLPAGSTANGRFDRKGDVDWYRFEVTNTQPIELETVAQRWLRSPVDTSLAVLDSAGKLLAEADDGIPDAGYEQPHDFRSPDSRLTFTPPAAGIYFVRVTDQAASNGPRAVYRLTIKPARPDFELTLFPDAVPIWGPGSTAAVLVKLDRHNGLESDVELSIAGLPEGWRACRHINPGEAVRRTSHYSQKQFLTITAPADALPGTAVPFQVMGSATVDGTMLERTAVPLSLYYTSDTGFFRASAQARAAVTRPHGVRLSSPVTELTVRQGESVKVPIQVHSDQPLTTISLTPNIANNGVGCGLGSPQNLAVVDGKTEAVVAVGAEIPPGVHALVVSLTWRSDIRIGMPGPCTELIALRVLPK